MVEQQIMKSYKLLSSNMEKIVVNDPMFQDMWYIVSVIKHVTIHLTLY